MLQIFWSGVLCTHSSLGTISFCLPGVTEGSKRGWAAGKRPSRQRALTGQTTGRQSWPGWCSPAPAGGTMPIPQSVLTLCLVLRIDLAPCLNKLLSSSLMQRPSNDSALMPYVCMLCLAGCWSNFQGRCLLATHLQCAALLRLVHGRQPCVALLPHAQLHIAGLFLIILRCFVLCTPCAISRLLRASCHLETTQHVTAALQQQHIGRCMLNVFASDLSPNLALGSAAVAHGARNPLVPGTHVSVPPQGSVKTMPMCYR